MKIEFDILDEQVVSLNSNGKVELVKHCKKWTDNILEEASRIEASRNEGTSVEITAAIINEAATYSRRFSIKSKIKSSYRIVQILSFLSTLLVGILFDIEKLNNISYIMWVTITFSIALATTVYLIFNKQCDE